MRRHKLTEQDARDQKAATVVGRLCLSGAITEPQYQAALEYHRQREASRRAMQAPDALAKPPVGRGEPSEEEHTRWCRVVIAKFEASTRAVMKAQAERANRGLNLIAALDYLVLRDEAHDHMQDALIVALAALARHYNLGP